MLNIFLTIIAGFFAISLIVSFVVGFIAFRQVDKENRAYKERVKNAMKKVGLGEKKR